MAGLVPGKLSRLRMRGCGSLGTSGQVLEDIFMCCSSPKPTLGYGNIEMQ